MADADVEVLEEVFKTILRLCELKLCFELPPPLPRVCKGLLLKDLDVGSGEGVRDSTARCFETISRGGVGSDSEANRSSSSSNRSSSS